MGCSAHDPDANGDGIGYIGANPIYGMKTEHTFTCIDGAYEICIGRRVVWSPLAGCDVTPGYPTGRRPWAQPGRRYPSSLCIRFLKPDESLQLSQEKRFKNTYDKHVTSKVF